MSAKNTGVILGSIFRHEARSSLYKLITFSHDLLCSAGESLTVIAAVLFVPHDPL